MATETLQDELLSIASGSTGAEDLESRFSALAAQHRSENERLADEVARTITVIRMHAKALEGLAAPSGHRRELERLNLLPWVEETRARAAQLRHDAGELERVSVAVGAIDPPERAETLYGIWEGVRITEEDIEQAKRSLFRPAYDDAI